MRSMPRVAVAFGSYGKVDTTFTHATAPAHRVALSLSSGRASAVGQPYRGRPWVLSSLLLGMSNDGDSSRRGLGRLLEYACLQPPFSSTQYAPIELYRRK